MAATSMTTDDSSLPQSGLLAEALAGPSRPRSEAQSKTPRKQKQKQQQSIPNPNPQPTRTRTSKPEPIPYQPTVSPDVDEEVAVHEVYERIAPHFSSTRYKPWPLITSFIHSLPANSLGLDSGGGNGKYVPTAREAGLEMIVMDRSKGLLEIAQQQDFGGSGPSMTSIDQNTGNGSDDARSRNKVEREDRGGGVEEGRMMVGRRGECVRGDLCGIGWREGVFDFAISIAAIHHLSTPSRRCRAVQALIYPLVHRSEPPYARFLIYVWAYEQSSGSKRKMGSTSTAHAQPQPDPVKGARENGIGGASPDVGTPEQADHGEVASTAATVGEKERVQDVLVPWVLQKQEPKSRGAGAKESQAIRSGLSSAATGNGVMGESDSTAADRDDGGDAAAAALSTEVTGRATATGTGTGSGAGKEGSQVFHRYYHLFVKGELGELVRTAAKEGGYRLVHEGEPDVELEGRREDGRDVDELRSKMSDMDVGAAYSMEKEFKVRDVGGGSTRDETGTEGEDLGSRSQRKWLRIVKEGWEADNWWLEGEVGVGVGP